MRSASFASLSLSSSFSLPFVLALALAACNEARPARFAVRPVVLEVDDMRAAAEPEATPETPITTAHALGRRTLVEGLDPRRPLRAGDVNAYDEVPHSSWFAEATSGPLAAVTYVGSGPPRPPLVVMPLRPEAGDGLVVVDARGLRYELARDPVDRAFVHTTATVVASRLARAIGYRAPESFIVSLKPSDLRVEALDGRAAPTGIVKSFFRDGAPAGADGGFRASATRWPLGKDLGPTPPEGTRGDDPNDRVAHEDRRTLRALRVVRAWLGLASEGIDTLRDVYVGAAGKGHVEHFIVGLEGALGARDGKGGAPYPGEPNAHPDPVEGREAQRALVTLGLGDRARARDPSYPRLGAFWPFVTSADYENEVGFAPTYRALPADAYWMGKRIAMVPEEAVRVAVDAAELDERTSARLVEILLARKRAVVARAFAGVTPCEVLHITRPSAPSEAVEAELVLRDLARTPDVSARFTIALLDSLGRPLAAERDVTPPGAVFTVAVPRAPYVVVRVSARRGAWASPRFFEAHVARDKKGQPTLVGVVH